MSIENIWGSINNKQDDDLTSLLHTSKISKFSSHNPIAKIRKNLLMNMIWGVLICLFYLFVIIFFPYWQVQVLISIVLIFSLWALYTAYIEYKKISTTISSTNSVLDEMKRHLHSVTTWMKLQQRVALFIYPVSAAGGFILGGVMGSGKPVHVIMSKPVMYVILLVTIIILVPICYLIAKWMFNKSFGKHLDALKINISALEEEK